ncbi:PolC-type DNA polymerase III [candidate division KSB1 bacterium]
MVISRLDEQRAELQDSGILDKKIFEIIASQNDSVPVETVAERLLQIRSGPAGILRSVISGFVRHDERVLFTAENELRLTDTGRRFRELLNSTFVVVDIETTGTRTYKDKITEIAAYKVSGGAIVESFESLVNPGRYIPFNITKITGITNDMVQDAPVIEHLIFEFLEFLGNGIFVAHNAPFDHRFINAALDESGYGLLNNRILCTCKMARKIYPSFRKYDLETVSSRLGIVNESRHRAAGDAAATASLLIRMLYDLPEINIFSLDELFNYA